MLMSHLGPTLNKKTGVNSWKKTPLCKEIKEKKRTEGFFFSKMKTAQKLSLTHLKPNNRTVKLVLTMTPPVIHEANYVII